MEAEVYNKLVARAHLRSIRLTSSKFGIKPEALQLDPNSWRHTIEGGVTECFYEEETGSLLGILGFQVTSKHGRKRLMSLSATYIVNYRIQGEGTLSACELFVDRVGKIAVYPYFRVLVASVVSQAGLTMPPLPIYSLAPRSLESAAGLEPLLASNIKGQALLKTDS